MVALRVLLRPSAFSAIKRYSVVLAGDTRTHVRLDDGFTGPTPGSMRALDAPLTA
jgi:hypothetical protein